MTTTLSTTRKWLESALLVAVLCATAARAESDTLGRGTGKEGDLVVKTPGRVINTFARVASPLAPGDTVVFASSARGFAAGDLVLVLQSTGLVAERRASLGPVDLSHEETGRWELVRLVAVSGDMLVLEQPLRGSYAAGVSQFIRVPEYRHVVVSESGSLVARPWDGSTGGVLAFLAQGVVRNDGRIEASGAGFRSGQAQPGGAGLHCQGLEEPAAQGGQKGEGLALGEGGKAGRGNAANGGGGGVCLLAGGGGGGHGGAGGQGGRSAPEDGSRRVGGLGGQALAGLEPNALTLGGGGGAGHGLEGRGLAGGRGGGIVFIRAQVLEGTGAVLADGEPGSSSAHESAGGGGAGGTLSLQFDKVASCGALSARGGLGGSTQGLRGGPGGGGGGGRVFLQAREFDAACSERLEVSGAPAGLQAPGSPKSRMSYGAQAGQRGTVVLQLGQVGTLDTTPPNTTITSGPNPITNQTSATFTFSANESPVTYECSLNGAAFAPCSTPANFTGLAQQSHTLRVRARDAAGNVDPTPASYSWTVDTTPPPAPEVTSPTAGQLVETLTPTFTGTAEPNSTLNVFVDGTYVGDTVADATGAWTLTATSPLAQGSRSVTAIATDQAGNDSATSTAINFTVDTEPPDTTLTSTPPATTNSTSAAFSFSASETPVTFECSLDGAAFSACTSPLNLTGLAEGSHTLEVRARDQANRVDSTPASYTWTVDTTIPNPPVIAVPAAGALLGTATPTFSGTAEPNSSVTVYVNGSAVGTTTADASGNWSLTSTALADGTYTATARATDAATNTSLDSPPVSFTVDFTPPDTSITSNPPATTNSTSATFSFSATKSPVTYECSLDGAAFSACTSPVTFSGLADGSHTLQVRAVSATGNRDASPASYSWTVDATPPPAPSITAPAAGAVLTTTTPAITGTAEPGSTVTVIINGAPAGTTTADASGNWSFTPTAPLAQGTNTVSATARDAQGNTSPASAPRTFTVDTTPPAAPVVTAPASGARVNSTTPAITGTAEPGSTVTLRIDGVVVGTTTANASGSWSFTPTTPLAEGSRTVTATARDAAGNTGPASAPRTFTVDTTPPAAPVITSPAQGAQLDNPRPPITGTAEPGSTVTVTIDGAPAGTTTADASGNWSFTPPANLADGSHTVTARARDAAGNTGPASAPRTFTVDATPPDTSITSAPPASTQSRNASFSFTATESPATFECSLDGAAFTPCTSPRSYSNLSVGSHTFRVRARDALGNVDATPATHTWRIQGGCGCAGSEGSPALALLGVMLVFTARGARRRKPAGVL